MRLRRSQQFQLLHLMRWHQSLSGPLSQWAIVCTFAFHYHTIGQLPGQVEGLFGLLPSCFLSVIISAACSRSAGRQSESEKSTVCKQAYYHDKRQVDDTRMTLTDRILHILSMLNNEIVQWFSSPPKMIYLGFGQKSSTAACIRPLSWQLPGKLCCLPLTQSYIR